MSKKKRNYNKRGPNFIDINDILLKNRQLFLFDEVKPETARNLVREIYALDKINSKPILMYINSPGGCVSDGFAIIDAMKMIGSPVITLITGEACSMAGIISVAGDNRYITEYSTWMGHPMSTGYHDYLEHVQDYVKASEQLEERIEKIFKKYTKLTNADYEKMKRGQLWLSADEALKKGVVDEIIGEKKIRRRKKK